MSRQAKLSKKEKCRICTVYNDTKSYKGVSMCSACLMFANSKLRDKKAVLCRRGSGLCDKVEKCPRCRLYQIISSGFPTSDAIQVKPNVIQWDPVLSKTGSGTRVASVPLANSSKMNTVRSIGPLSSLLGSENGTSTASMSSVSLPMRKRDMARCKNGSSDVGSSKCDQMEQSIKDMTEELGAVEKEYEDFLKTFAQQQGVLKNQETKMTEALVYLDSVSAELNEMNRGLQMARVTLLNLQKDDSLGA